MVSTLLLNPGLLSLKWLQLQRNLWLQNWKLLIRSESCELISNIHLVMNNTPISICVDYMGTVSHNCGKRAVKTEAMDWKSVVIKRSCLLKLWVVVMAFLQSTRKIRSRIFEFPWVCVCLFYWFSYHLLGNFSIFFPSWWGELPSNNGANLQ